MSTVDRKTAFKVASGEYPEDEVQAIILYENMFNGNFAYKLVFDKTKLNYFLYMCPAMTDPVVVWDFSTDGFITEETVRF